MFGGTLKNQISILEEIKHYLVMTLPHLDATAATHCCVFFLTFQSVNTNMCSLVTAPQDCGGIQGSSNISVL